MLIFFKSINLVHDKKNNSLIDNKLSVKILG